jgi:hypothetical protein
MTEIRKSAQDGYNNCCTLYNKAWDILHSPEVDPKKSRELCWMVLLSTMKFETIFMDVMNLSEKVINNEEN